MIESRTVGEKEVDIYRSSKYRVITVVPLEKDPVMNVYLFSQEELDDFLHEYSRYSEFIVSVEQVEAIA